MIKYPLTHVTKGLRTAWLLRALKLLELEHNILGDWQDVDLPVIKLTRYQKLRAQVQQTYPYVEGEHLSQEDWAHYRDGRFEEKFNLITGALAGYKTLCGDSATSEPNLDDDIDNGI